MPHEYSAVFYQQYYEPISASLFKETRSAIVILGHKRHIFNKPRPKLRVLLEKFFVELSEIYVFIKARQFFLNQYHFRVLG